MKVANLLRILALVCFLILWIPFAMIMITGPFSLTIWGPDHASSKNAFWSMTPWVVLTTVLGVAAAFFLIASSIASGMSNILIEAKGADAEAEILTIKDTGTRINDDPVVQFSLRVRPTMHPPFVGQARRMISIVELPQYQPGKVVKVKYIPGKEQVAIVGL